MTRSTRAATLLSWLMFLVGGAALFACLFLPPWLELRALRQAHVGAEQRIAVLEDRLTRVTRQIEHLQDDPAYLERLARDEFRVETPGVEIIHVEPRPVRTATVSERSALEHAARTNPLVAVFVLDETRPIVMAMAGVVMIVALVLLIRGGTSKPL